MPGAFYHLGFPIANRYAWGMYGSSFVIYNRILLSLVWYAVQAWIGGRCVYVCLEAIWPNLEERIPNHLHATGLTSASFLTYCIFCLISLPLIWIRPHKLKVFLYIGVASIMFFELVLLIWALATMDGFGDTITGHPDTQDTSVGWSIMYGIISAIGGIAAGILNQSDYARFARRPRDAIYGQLASAATYSIMSSVIGILVTAATQRRYGAALWSLPDLLIAMMHAGGSRSRAAGFFGGVALVVSQWGINIPGNALSGGFDFAATFPRYINIRRGAYITALLSMVVNPWQLLATASTFLAVLSSYGVFLGPMVGLMISSYYVVNRRKINVDDLFRGNKSSIYWYTYGINWRAPLAVRGNPLPSFFHICYSKGVHFLTFYPVGHRCIPIYARFRVERQQRHPCLYRLDPCLLPLFPGRIRHHIRGLHRVAPLLPCSQCEGFRPQSCYGRAGHGRVSGQVGCHGGNRLWYPERECGAQGYTGLGGVSDRHMIMITRYLRKIIPVPPRLLAK
jgi:NCS1 family nucleobase:cation symporter-1